MIGPPAAICTDFLSTAYCRACRTLTLASGPRLTFIARYVNAPLPVTIRDFTDGVDCTLFSSDACRLTYENAFWSLPWSVMIRLLAVESDSPISMMYLLACPLRTLSLFQCGLRTATICLPCWIVCVMYGPLKTGCLP